MEQEIPSQSQIVSLLKSLGKPTQNLNQNFYCGYVIGFAGIPPNRHSYFGIFRSIQNIVSNFKDKLINEENVFEIMVESMFAAKQTSDPNKKVDQFKKTFQESVNALFENPTYFKEKWARNSSAWWNSEDKATMQLIKKMQEIDKKQRQTEQKLNEAMARELEKKEKEQIKRKREEEDKESMECQICLEHIPTDEIGSLDCGHVFHKKCIHEHITAHVNEKKIDIACPSGCGKLLPLEDVMEFIDGRTKQRYEQFCFDNYVEKNRAQVSWCPSPGCSAVFSFEDDLDNYRCDVCKKHYCLKCRCNYHYGMSCAEYRISNSYGEDDKQFEKFVKGAKFKQCPHCSYWVERIEGCSTMRCKCGKQFCYECGGSSCPHGSCSNSGKNLKRVIGRRR